MKGFLAFKLSDAVFTTLKMLNMPTIDGFNTYEHDKFHAELSLKKMGTWLKFRKKMHMR